MEEESFDDEEIARYLNENYIAIKVDREVRPDIDAIYMTAIQMMTGRGGWPMTVWLTPDREPFSGGAYFPARDGDRGVSMGFLTMLRRMKEAYDEEPDRVVEVAAQMAQLIRESMVPAGRGEGLPEAQVLHAVAEYYRERFDSTYGGLAGAPKFPQRSLAPPSSSVPPTHRRRAVAGDGDPHARADGGRGHVRPRGRWLSPLFHR